MPANFYKFKKHLGLVKKVNKGNLFQWLPNRRVVDATRLKRWDSLSLLWAVANISNLPQYWFKYHSKLSYEDDYYRLLSVVLSGKSAITTISPKLVDQLAILLGTYAIYKGNRIVQFVDGKWHTVHGSFVDRTRCLSITSRRVIADDGNLPRGVTHAFLTIDSVANFKTFDYDTFFNNCIGEGTVAVICTTPKVAKLLGESSHFPTIEEIVDTSSELKPEFKFLDARFIFIPKS